MIKVLGLQHRFTYTYNCNIQHTIQYKTYNYKYIQLHHDESPWAAGWCLLDLPAPECSILTSRTLSCWCLLTLPAPECSIFCKQLLLKQNNPGFLYSLLGFTISCRFNIQIRMPFLCILNYPCFSLLWLVISNVPADSRWAFLTSREWKSTTPFVKWQGKKVVIGFDLYNSNIWSSWYGDMWDQCQYARSKLDQLFAADYGDMQILRLWAPIFGAADMVICEINVSSPPSSSVFWPPDHSGGHYWKSISPSNQHPINEFSPQKCRVRGNAIWIARFVMQ